MRCITPSLHMHHRLWLNSGFSPLSLGPVLWLDAAQIQSLNDGDSVGTWPDMSGNGNNATQGTAAAKPTYKVNIQNGKPVVRFDGVDDHLTNSTFAVSMPATFLIVYRIPSVPVSSFRLESGENNGMNIDIFPTQFGIYAGAQVLGGSVATGAHVVSCVFSATSTLWNDGVQQLSGNAGNLNQSGISIGGLGNGFLSGDIGEILVFDYALSTSQRQQVEGWLRAKWGTP